MIKFENDLGNPGLYFIQKLLILQMTMPSVPKQAKFFKSIDKKGHSSGQEGKRTSTYSFDKSLHKRDHLYYEAAKVLKQVSLGKGSIRTLCYASSHSNKPAILGLVIETCKHRRVLQSVIDKVGPLVKGKPAYLKDQFLLLVMLHDHLIRGKLECSQTLADRLLNGNKARIHSEWVLACMKESKHKKGGNDEFDSVRHFFIRLNTLVISNDTKLDEEKLRNLIKEHSCERQLNIPLIELYRVTSLQAFLPWIDSGHVIVQDKASCLPPLILAPKPGEHVIDTCAAPGNKTSLLWALLNDRNNFSSKVSRLDAWERDPDRYETLVKMLTKARALPSSNLYTHLDDFLNINPLEYPLVTAILVDPSCSGSGILRLEKEAFSKENNSNQDDSDHQFAIRLSRLASFQCKILAHAMSFPKCTRVVYSTCSVHEEENEEVLEKVLREVNAIESSIMTPWQVADGVMSEWKRRGIPSETRPWSDRVIRADPRLDGTHGFFVALLTRTLKDK